MHLTKIHFYPYKNYHYSKSVKGLCGCEGSYGFAFNGKEKEDEVQGGGNTYDYGFRIYNSRLGRFLSVDPLTRFYPAWTTYHFAQNRPIKAIDFDGLQAWDGPNDVKDVMSIESYQQYTKISIKTMSYKTAEKHLFDCADLAYYFLIKYFEHKQVHLKFKVNNIEINSGDLKYKDAEDFFEKTRLMFGASYVHNKLTYRTGIKLGTGDLITSDYHIMINNPTGDEPNGQFRIAQASGYFYGYNDPRTDVKRPFSATDDLIGVSGSKFGRWTMLKDAPLVESPVMLTPRPISTLPLVIPDLKSPEPPPEPPTKN